MSHPDMWPGIIVRDLADAGREAGRESLRDPLGGPDRYSYRELRRFADVIRDRLKQYPTVGKIDEIGTQNEAIYLYYSSRRFSALDLSPQTIAARLERRNINLPGGRVETPQQNVVVHPSGEFQSEQELGEVVIDVQGGYPTYLRDLVDIVRGYEDPPGVMNFRSVKVDADDPPEAQDARRVDRWACRATATTSRPLPAQSQAADHPCHHAGGAADQGHRTSTPSPATWTRRWTRSRACCPTICRSSGRTTSPREVRREGPAVRPEPDRSGGHRGPGGDGVHGMAQRPAGGRFHSR